MSVTRSIELTGPLKTPHRPATQAMRGSRVKPSNRFVQILEQSRRKAPHPSGLPFAQVTPTTPKEQDMMVSKQLSPYDMTEKDWMLLRGLEICSEALNIRKTSPIPTAVKQFTPARKITVESIPFENRKIRSQAEIEPERYQEVGLDSPTKLCLSEFDQQVRKSRSKSPPKRNKSTGVKTTMHVDGRNCQTAGGGKRRSKRKESVGEGAKFERYPRSVNLLDRSIEQEGKEEGDMSPYLTQKIVTRMVRKAPSSPPKPKEMSQSLPESQAFEESKEFNMMPISQRGSRKRNNSRVEIRN